jgi:hypothetical protein
MQTIELKNLTSWDDTFVHGIVGRICNELHLRKPVLFLFQETWTAIDEDNGNIVEGTERPEIPWDGDACKMAEGGWARVCISPNTVYPAVWNINPSLPGQYLRHVTWFNDPIELLLYLSAHELRHLWQFEHPRKIAQIRRLMEIDDEADADFHALRLLSRYRQNSADFVENESNS